MSSNLYQLFEDAMQDFVLVSPQSSIAIGVSGGSDSMALLYCLTKWAKQRAIKLFALTVDHNLRKESRQEAQAVAEWAEKWGVEHQILIWENPEITKGMQAKARKARFDLMLSFCKKHKIEYLALAHHLEDQAETFLMRLARGSGVDGLSAMLPVKEFSGIKIIRPFLKISSQGFKAFLQQNQITWFEDPSNQNHEYQRVRIRKLMPQLDREGLTSQVLAKTAEQMQRVRSLLEHETARRLQKNIVLYQEGYIDVEPEIFKLDEEEIIWRCLKNIIMCVSGLEYPLRLEQLSRLAQSLKDLDQFKGATLSGCRILKVQRDHAFKYRFVREFKKVVSETIIEQSVSFLWDHRFLITISNVEKKLFIRPVGVKLWKELIKDNKIKLLNPIPRLAGIVLPALFDDKDVLLIPHLGYKREHKFYDLKMEIEFNPVYMV